MVKKKWVLILLISLMFTTTSQANADVHVKGYFKKDGTYVQPHYRSNPDGVFSNNFSTYGNINPYTGKLGTKSYPDYNPFYNYFYTPFAFSDIGNYYWINPNILLDDNSGDNSTISTDTTSNTTTDENVNTDTSTIQDSSTTTDTTKDTTFSSDQSDNINVASDFIDSYDTPDQVEAKNMLVDYFNDINTRSYIPAYNRWDSSWQLRHPYDAFETGYVDVINTIDSITATNFTNGISLEGDIFTTEGWEQSSHKYHFVYYVQKKDYTWKLVKGTLEKLW